MSGYQRMRALQRIGRTYRELFSVFTLKTTYRAVVEG